MKTSVEREGPTRVKLLIEVEPAEIDPVYTETLKRMAREANVPGFRKGKVPPHLFESRVGRDTVFQEALRDALPFFYSQAVRDEEVRAVSAPDIEVTKSEEGQALEFTAIVDVRPEIRVPEYKGIEVVRPPAEATEEELEAQLEKLRDRFGTLEVVARNAISGDYMTIDLNGYRHDEQIEEVSAKDLLYELGSNSFVPELDNELIGKRTGDILKFNSTLPERFGEPYGGQEVSFTAIVKEVQTKKLPPLDDEFAKTASEFETLDELKAEVKSRIELVKRASADGEVRRKVIEDLVERIDISLPESLVDREVQARLNALLRDLARHKITLDQYLQGMNTTRETLIDEQRLLAEKAVSTELVIEAVAESEKIEVTPEELSEEITKLAEQLGRTPEEVRSQLEDSDQVGTVSGDILRRKTLDFLVEHAKITDEGK